MIQTLQERILDTLKSKNIKWLILDGISNDEFGNLYEYWTCAESIDLDKKNEDWHDALYIDNQDVLQVITNSISPFSRSSLYLDGKRIC